MTPSLDVGSKCAFILPQKFINPHVTPAIGLILTRRPSTRSVILVEEVWQFKGLKDNASSLGINKSGGIKKDSWGWQSIPELIKDEKEYLIIELLPRNMLPSTEDNMDILIKRSIEDFFKLLHRG